MLGQYCEGKHLKSSFRFFSLFSLFSLLAACGGIADPAFNGEALTPEVIDANPSPVPTIDPLPSPVPVQGSPVADISVNGELVGQIPLTLSFDGSASMDADGSIDSYIWKVSGEERNGEILQYTFSMPGFYTVALEVRDNSGLTNFTEVVVEAQSPELTQTPAEIAADLYQAQCLACHGDNGQGVGNIPNLRVAYPLPRMTEIVRAMPPGSTVDCGELLGCEIPLAQYILDNFARQNTAPAADASDSQNLVGNAPLNVVFDGGQSADDHGIVEYRWDFGDGSVGSGEQVSHVYTNPGNYSAVLTVIDEEGLSDESAAILVQVQQSDVNQPPVAVLSSDFQAGIAPFEIQFTSVGSVDDKAIIEYRWDFQANGETDSLEENPSFIYMEPGQYRIALTAVDEDIETNTAYMDVRVYENASFGQERYASQCAGCHGASGQGVNNAGPRLSKTWNQSDLLESVIHMINVNNSDCNGVERDSCAQSLADYVFEQFNTAAGESPFACNLPEPAMGIDIKRLSLNEYKNTMRDVLAMRLDANIASAIVDDDTAGVDRWVPHDTHLSGFRQLDNKVSLDYVEGWFRFSLQAVDEILPRIEDFVGDDCASDASDKACMRTFIENAGRVFFRKPLRDTQINEYTQSSDYRELLVRMFNAPDFLYHMEIDGVDVANRNDLRQLTPYELAARLSYTFWQSLPDQQLIDDIESGALENNYDQVLSRVMSSTKARDGSRSFFEDWWLTEETPVPSEILTRGMRLVDRDPNAERDTSLALEFDAASYRDAAIEEVLDLASYVTWQVNGRVGDLYTNNLSFARHPDLAKAYGVPVWNGDFNNMISLPSDQRSGLLTRAAFHIYGGSRSNPILKGARIRKRLLCDIIPLPADNTPPDVNPQADWTTRELITAQTESTPGCRACHETSINPPGFATEDFDVLGRFRETEIQAVAELDGFGGATANIIREVAIDSTVMPFVDSESDTRSTNSGADLGLLMAETPKTAQCLARTYFRHTFSRMEDDAGDGCVLRSIEDAARTGTLQDALRSVAEQAEFKLRKISE